MVLLVGTMAALHSSAGASLSTQLESRSFALAEQRCEMWLEHNKALSVTIKAEVRSGSRSLAASQIGIQLALKQLKLHWTSEPDSSHGPANWYYEADLKSLKGFDLSRQERLESGGGMAQLVANLPLQARILLVRGSFSKFARAFVNLGRWQPAGRGVWRHKGAGSITEFQFSEKTGALVRFYLKGKSSTTQWSYGYEPFKKPLLDLGSSWVKVPAFLQPSPLPTYADAQATKAASRAIGAFDTLQNLHFKVSGDNGAQEVWRVGTKVAQSDSSGSWVYRPGHLEALIQGKHFSGKVKSSEVNEKLQSLGLAMEPMARCLVLRLNFGQSFFVNSARATLVGKVVLGGVELELIQIDDFRARTLVAVDPHGWIRQLQTTTFDGKGRTLTRSERNYDPVPMSPVPVISGTPVLALPRSSSN